MWPPTNANAMRKSLAMDRRHSNKSAESKINGVADGVAANMGIHPDVNTYAFFIPFGRASHAANAAHTQAQEFRAQGAR